RSSFLRHVARIDADVGRRLRAIPRWRLRTVRVTEDVPLLLPGTLPGANDVAGVAAAALSVTLAQQPVRSASNRRLVQVAGDRFLERHHLIGRHVRAVLRSAARDNVEWLRLSRARFAGRWSGAWRRRGLRRRGRAEGLRVRPRPDHRRLKCAGVPEELNATG